MSKKKNYNRVSLPTDIEDIITKTCKTTIDLYKEKEKKITKGDKFRKTKLLMENYLSFAKHYEKAVDNARSVGDIIDVSKLDDDELFIHSIRRSKARTLIMVSHIDQSLELLKKSMERKGQLERYSVIEEIYLREDSLSFEQMAEEFSCNERTVRRWKNDMIFELSILIFGFEAIEDRLS